MLSLIKPSFRSLLFLYIALLRLVLTVFQWWFTLHELLLNFIFPRFVKNSNSLIMHSHFYFSLLLSSKLIHRSPVSQPIRRRPLTIIVFVSMISKAVFNYYFNQFFYSSCRRRRCAVVFFFVNFVVIFFSCHQDEFLWRSQWTAFIYFFC